VFAGLLPPKFHTNEQAHKIRNEKHLSLWPISQKIQVNPSKVGPFLSQLLVVPRTGIFRPLHGYFSSLIKGPGTAFFTFFFLGLPKEGEIFCFIGGN